MVAEIFGKTEVRFNKTELLECSCVTSQQKAKIQPIQLLLKKTVLVGSDENC